MGRLELSCLEISTEVCLSSKNVSPCGPTSLCTWKAEFLNSVNDREFGFQPFFKKTFGMFYEVWFGKERLT